MANLALSGRDEQTKVLIMVTYIIRWTTKSSVGRPFHFKYQAMGKRTCKILEKLSYVNISPGSGPRSRVSKPSLNFPNSLFTDWNNYYHYRVAMALVSLACLWFAFRLSNTISEAL